MRIGTGIGIQYSRVVGGLSAEALAWEARIIAKGGTIPAATLAIFDQYFFKPALANGNILSELDRLNIYCGLVGYEIAARTNIIKSAHYVTPVSSPTFDNNGYKSSGTSYLNLNYNANTDGVKLTQNSVFQFVTFNNPVLPGATKRSIGVITNGGVNRLELYITDGGFRVSFNNQSASTTTATSAAGYVHLTGKRGAASGAGATSIKVNETITTAATISVAVPNSNVFELTSNLVGPLGDYDTNYHLASGHGSNNVDDAALRTILNNLFTALAI